jgi:hypothetical protein
MDKSSPSTWTAKLLNVRGLLLPLLLLPLLPLLLLLLPLLPLLLLLLLPLLLLCSSRLLCSPLVPGLPPVRT